MSFASNHLGAEGERDCMGTVIRFPGERRFAEGGAAVTEHRDTAIIVILPVVRIERMTETPSDGFAPDSNSASRRKRRRRGSRT
jgi:hypothetical protein